MPRFSIIIPTYNRAELLRLSLESVDRQVFHDFEVIVVDDGSTDHTEEILQQYSASVTVMRQSNGGPGAARNLGAGHASGDYLAFLDSDDLWFPWTLQTVSDLIDSHSPTVLSGALLPFETESELTNIRLQDTRADIYSDYFNSYQSGYFVGAGMAFIRRHEFLSAGGFTTDIVNCEDHDLMLRLGTAPNFVKIHSPPTIAWRRHSNSTTMNYRRTFEGVQHLLQSELRSDYPGGSKQIIARRNIICSHARSTSLECLQGGLTSEAWQLYRATLGWHLSLRRLKFVFGFPVRCIQMAVMKRLFPVRRDVAAVS